MKVKLRSIEDISELFGLLSYLNSEKRHNDVEMITNYLKIWSDPAYGFGCYLPSCDSTTLSMLEIDRETADIVELPCDEEWAAVPSGRYLCGQCVSDLRRLREFLALNDKLIQEEQSLTDTLDIGDEPAEEDLAPAETAESAEASSEDSTAVAVDVGGQSVVELRESVSDADIDLAEAAAAYAGARAALDAVDDAADAAYYEEYLQPVAEEPSEAELAAAVAVPTVTQTDLDRSRHPSQYNTHPPTVETTVGIPPSVFQSSTEPLMNTAPEEELNEVGKEVNVHELPTVLSTPVVPTLEEVLASEAATSELPVVEGDSPAIPPETMVKLTTMQRLMDALSPSKDT